jgi:hypothetical protein
MFYDLFKERLFNQHNIFIINLFVENSQAANYHLLINDDKLLLS